MKYSIKYKDSLGFNKFKQITATSRKEAMEKFNKLSRGINAEIKEIIELKDSETELMPIASSNSIELSKYDEISDMLKNTNRILYEQLKKVKEVDINKKQEALIEISKTNSLAGIAKTLVQSISMGIRIDKSKEDS